MWTPKMDSADSQVVSDNAIPHPSLPAAVPMSDAVRAKPRGHIIAVTSGKGGVGKTFVSANLAAALTRHGLKVLVLDAEDRKSTRLNSSHLVISYAVFCLKKKKGNSDWTSTPNYDVYTN